MSDWLLVVFIIGPSKLAIYFRGILLSVFREKKFQAPERTLIIQIVDCAKTWWKTQFTKVLLFLVSFSQKKKKKTTQISDGFFLFSFFVPFSRYEQRLEKKKKKKTEKSTLCDEFPLYSICTICAFVDFKERGGKLTRVRVLRKVENQHHLSKINITFL